MEGHLACGVPLSSAHRHVIKNIWNLKDYCLSMQVFSQLHHRHRTHFYQMPLMSFCGTGCWSCSLKSLIVNLWQQYGSTHFVFPKSVFSILECLICILGRSSDNVLPHPPELLPRSVVRFLSFMLQPLIPDSLSLMYFSFQYNLIHRVPADSKLCCSYSQS